jgi:hypothetical protein
MITITINFSSSKILCGLSMMYWVETVTVSNIEIKLEVFPALHMFRSGPENQCFVLFC